MDALPTLFVLLPLSPLSRILCQHLSRAELKEKVNRILFLRFFFFVETALVSI